LKKATLKDIAREAQVSAATVSYVLNKVQNQTIPDETKCRVMEAAERLSYVPNLTAKALVKRKTGLIGILISKERERPFWKDCQDYGLVSRLERLLAEKGYHVVVSSLEAPDPKLDIVLERQLEGAFLINVRKDVFYRISNRFKLGAPLVIIDSLIDDDLFHKVHFDWTAAIVKAKEKLDWNDSCFLVTEPFHDEELFEAVKSASGLQEERILTMETEQELAVFLSGNKGNRGIVVNEFLGAMAAKYIEPRDLAVIVTAGCGSILPNEVQKVFFRDEKAQAAFEIMMGHLENGEQESSEKFVRIGVE
jgi:hypothetical protein